MIFDDNILKKLPDNPRIALYIMCEHFLQLDNDRADNIEAKAYYRAYAALLGVLEATTIKYDRPKLIKDPGKDVAQIRSFFRKIFNKFDFVSSDVQLSKVHNKFQSRFTPEFGYTFTDGDLSRIQTLINELRDLIYKSELFEEKHKQRILEKLESLQSEIHKKMTSLAKLWDLMGEAGVALGKFGTDAKPIVDRIKEIAQITWRAQASAEELPSGTSFPLLASGYPEDNEKETND